MSTSVARRDVTIPSVILITDPQYPLAHMLHTIEAASRGLDPKRLLVQLRDKTSAPDALRSTARALHEITQRVGARFVVNAIGDRTSPHVHAAARLDVAAELVGAGAHVACDAITIAKTRTIFGAEAWISTPAHTDGDVTVAIDAGATAVLVSPIWESPNKGPARGPNALTSARAAAAAAPQSRKETRILVYALGGVDPSRAVEAHAAGADGVAVIRALFDADDPARVARLLDAPFHD